MRRFFNFADALSLPGTPCSKRITSSRPRVHPSVHLSVHLSMRLWRHLWRDPREHPPAQSRVREQVPERPEPVRERERERVLPCHMQTKQMPQKRRPLAIYSLFSSII